MGQTVNTTWILFQSATKINTKSKTVEVKLGLYTRSGLVQPPVQRPPCAATQGATQPPVLVDPGEGRMDVEGLEGLLPWGQKDLGASHVP